MSTLTRIGSLRESEYHQKSTVVETHPYPLRTGSQTKYQIETWNDLKNVGRTQVSTGEKFWDYPQNIEDWRIRGL